MNPEKNKVFELAREVVKSDNQLGVRAYLCQVEISSKLGYNLLGAFDLLRPNKVYRELKKLEGVNTVAITFLRDERGKQQGRIRQ